MDDIIRAGLYAQRHAKTKDEAEWAMAKTCFACNAKHVGYCFCDTGHKCLVEKAHEEKMKELEELELNR